MTKLFMHFVLVLIVGVLSMPAAPHADQAQYFYDEPMQDSEGRPPLAITPQP